MNFEIKISGSSSKRSNLILLHLLAVFAFSITGFVFLIAFYYTKSSYSAIAGMSLLAFALMLMIVIIFKNKWVQQRLFNDLFRLAEAAIAIVFCCIFILKQWKTPAVLFTMLSASILIGFFYEKTKQKILFVFVNEKGIRLPSLTKRKFIHWQEINSVLLRHGVLTIDCYNNYLYQWNILPVDFNEKQFEKFCEEQVLKNEDKRVADW